MKLILSILLFHRYDMIFDIYHVFINFLIFICADCLCFEQVMSVREWIRLRLRRHMVRELHIYTIAWLHGYVVTQHFSNFFSNFLYNLHNRNRNQRNLVTVTQTHGERVAQLQSSLVTWLRGYVVTQLFFNFFFNFFSIFS